MRLIILFRRGAAVACLMPFQNYSNKQATPKPHLKNF